MKIGRFNILKRQMGLDDEAAEKLRESFDTITAILDSSGVAHKQIKMDEEQVATMIAEGINAALGEETPENVMDVARDITGKLMEMLMATEENMMEDEEMAYDEQAMSEDEQKALAEAREKQYQQQEKLHALLDQLINESVGDAEAINVLSESYKALNERVDAVDDLVGVVKAMGEDMKVVKRQLAQRPRASVAPETLATPDEISQEVQKEMEDEDFVYDEKLGLRLKKE